MKIDQEYLKALLNAFEDSNEPHTSISKLLETGFDHRTNEFRFHMRLLQDRGLIGRVDGESGIGYFSPQSDDRYDDGFFDEVPLRLTASGHDFLEAIRNKEVWATLKSGFKDASIGTLVTVSKELLNRALTKQLDKYFD
ncbi:TPA: DUF2513 domain-containing protein [Klebsiella pneumoniae]|uniref:DUF2513 domain-containing protein n=1 Tax=Klebsiella pneumoniae TaxID=573 RepID=UPI001C597A6F|nr:DUF2513 domain-containing protein [Klebsiella pneumoniae]MBW3342162.1 DUF2513 domain-containing protein [Klebsiella pneumoniae]HCA3680705.1 DUF2513 domain-containing protein [Klebsiella pneumoniae]HCM5235671.1 DUF2513 domain-containing protein [Klebsiella pneumoniae]HCM5601771.1 DUF2513 domain-containing protein [Klebsiella pneumoniae]